MVRNMTNLICPANSGNGQTRAELHAHNISIKDQDVPPCRSRPSTKQEHSLSHLWQIETRENRRLYYESPVERHRNAESLDPTESFFVCGMRYAFQNDKPPTLRWGAPIPFSLMGEKWWNPIKTAQSLCIGWASAVDSVEHSSNVQVAIIKALLDMMNSPHWRPRIVTGKWKL